MAHVHDGREVCPTCNRPMPREKEDDGTPKPKRSRFTLLVPEGEEGVLDEMLDQLVTKYRAVWGGIEISEKGWRYRACHLGLYTALQAPLPSEEGE